MTIMNINTAANAITLTAEDVLSAAGNRFDLAANVVLAAREAITLRYDATLTRWRAIGGKG